MAAFARILLFNTKDLEDQEHSKIQGVCLIFNACVRCKSVIELEKQSKFMKLNLHEEQSKYY